MIAARRQAFNAAFTDERYAATTGVIENANGTDQRQFLPGDGRGVFTGLECRW